MRDRSEDQIRLVLIRHGATASNKEKRYLGRTDEPLSKEGIDGLLKMRDAGVYPAFDCLFSGPMKRCIQTAEILCPDRKAIVIPEWTETDFGAFEGKNYAELKDDARYLAWIESGGRLPFPDGEGREEFAARCKRGLRRMTGCLLKTVLRDRTRLVTAGLIVHGGTIMALLSEYGGGDYFDYQVANGSGYTCVLKNPCGDPRISDIRPLRKETGT